MHLRLAARADEIDWRRVQVFFGDERCLPPGHPDRNDRAARLALLDRVPIPEGHVHAIEADSPDAAELYESELRAAFRLTAAGALPVFDLVVLGMGPDGHTASLFPGFPQLDERRRLAVRVEGAPKPPPERITLTLPVLNAAREALFLVTGAEKRAAAAKAAAGDPSVPAGRVAAAKTLVFLDEAASR
jgi:6-phosphogluconolactonase